MKAIQLENVKSLNNLQKANLRDAVQKANPFKALSAYMEGNEIITHSSTIDSVIINELFCPRQWLIEIYA
jgi:hypothetical protein